MGLRKYFRCMAPSSFCMFSPKQGESSWTAADFCSAFRQDLDVAVLRRRVGSCHERGPRYLPGKTDSHEPRISAAVFDWTKIYKEKRKKSQTFQDYTNLFQQIRSKQRTPVLKRTNFVRTINSPLSACRHKPWDPHRPMPGRNRSVPPMGKEPPKSNGWVLQKQEKQGERKREREREKYVYIYCEFPFAAWLIDLP